ncbi:MAG: serine/threonine protein phosphatase [Rhodospirillales bacterium]|jgi:serine/threonine protein phosphatase 1|nr:serine/threonine protein phosphatase [Rhodospirillales bacterium]
MAVGSAARRRRPGPVPDVAEFAPTSSRRVDQPLAFRPAPGWLPPGHRVYAVGDVHGCAAPLAAMLNTIAKDLAARPAARAELVLLGDYIDFGPDSAGVLTRLAGGAPLPGAALTALRGDHEQMLLDALAGDKPAATDWLAAGGGASLASWGIPREAPRTTWEATLPAAHLAFLRRLKLSHRAGGYLFVHAGLRPGVALARQRREDVLAIRHPFLSEPAEFGVTVVHGHSVARAVAVEPGRIGLDTGAGLGGALSCAVLEDDLIACMTVPTDEGALR